MLGGIGRDRDRTPVADNTACASAWIAAGVNVKTLTTFMGHANVSTTFDPYGHLMPGGEDDALVLIDAYHERSTVPRTVPRAPETVSPSGSTTVSNTVG